MLVLSRKIGEKIMIGNDIIVTVVEIDRNKIRLGFQAPPNVAIYREELYKKLKGQARADSQSATGDSPRSSDSPGTTGPEGGSKPGGKRP